jgi:hypothetical protein
MADQRYVEVAVRMFGPAREGGIKFDVIKIYEMAVELAQELKELWGDGYRRLMAGDARVMEMRGLGSCSRQMEGLLLHRSS